MEQKYQKPTSVGEIERAIAECSFDCVSICLLAGVMDKLCRDAYLRICNVSERAGERIDRCAYPSQATKEA
jgi:hypothetical protein